MLTKEIRLLAQCERWANRGHIKKDLARSRVRLRILILSE